MYRMKKTKILLASLFITVGLTACGNMTDDGSGAFNFMQGFQQGDDHGDVINKENVESSRPYTQYGYERHTKDVAEQEEMPGYSVYDRPLLAESISEMAAVIPDVEDAGVLVTGEHALIAYETTASDREAVADQVKKTATSILPPYYDVYVADNPALMDDLERFKGHYSENRAEMDTLQQTINEMKTYPQGDRINSADNE